MKMAITHPIQRNPWVLPRQHRFGCIKGPGTPTALSSTAVARAKVPFLGCICHRRSKTNGLKGAETLDQTNCSLVAW